MRYTTLIAFIIFNNCVTAQVVEKNQALLFPSLTPGNNVERNIEMSSMYKELQPFSTIAPFGEIHSGTAYVFTADINPLYIFSNSIRSRWNFGIGARVMARMFQTNSFPIKTPSYIPTIKLFFSMQSDPLRYSFLDFSFTHHSNGQDAAALINSQWNTTDGNFSTNFLTLGFNKGDNDGLVRKHSRFYAIQHIGLGNFLSQDENLKGYYGQTRVGWEKVSRHLDNFRVFNSTTNTTLKRYTKETWRFRRYIEYIINGHQSYSGYSLKRRINVELQFFKFTKTLREGSFFVGAGYYGEDPYNIYFPHHYFFFKFGIAGGSPFFKAN